MGFPSGITISLEKLVKVVTFLEAIMPGLAIVLMAVLQNSKDDSMYESVDVTYIEKHHAIIDTVVHIMNFFIFYLHLLVRIGLAMFLWKSVIQRNVKRLIIWCVCCGATTLIGIVPCAVLLTYKLPLGQVATIIIVTLTITSAFSLTTVLVHIRKIRSGAMRDYEDYMCLRFEKREMLAGTANA